MAPDCLKIIERLVWPCLGGLKSTVCLDIVKIMYIWAISTVRMANFFGFYNQVTFLFNCSRLRKRLAKLFLYPLFSEVHLDA